MSDNINIFRKLQDRNSKEFKMLLQRYLQLEQEFDAAKDALTFKGKTLNAVNNEQAEWPIYVDERFAEVKNICKKFETVVEMVRGDIVRELKGAAHDVGRDITKFVDRDNRFLDVNEYFLMFDEQRERYSALSGAWTTRGYAVRNKVDMLVHQIKDNLI